MRLELQMELLKPEIDIDYRRIIQSEDHKEIRRI